MALAQGAGNWAALYVLCVPEQDAAAGVEASTMSGL